VRFKVFLLRRQGRRLSLREARNGPAFVGTLVSYREVHNGEQYDVLRLQPSDPMSTEHPQPLFEPTLLGFAPLAFRLRGFERIESKDGPRGVVQEWHIEDAVT
jgi:hypothetical protein